MKKKTEEPEKKNRRKKQTKNKGSIKQKNERVNIHSEASDCCEQQNNKDSLSWFIHIETVAI